MKTRLSGRIPFFGLSLFLIILSKSIKANEIVSSAIINQMGGEQYITMGCIILLIFLSLLIILLTKRFRDTVKTVKEIEERYNLAMHATNDGLFDWDLVNNTIYYSPGWKKMLGYEEDELENDFSVWEQLTHPDDVNKSWAILNEHIKGKRDRFEIEFRMKHKNGGWVDVLSRANAILNNEGKAVRLVGTHIDVTTRKIYEKSLYESERRLYTLMSNLPGMAYRCKNDPGWSMMFVSDGCLQLTGYNRAELQESGNIKYGELILEEDSGNVWDSIQESLKNKTSFEIEYRIKIKDGSVKHVWERGIGVYENEKLVYLEGFITDITKRIETERALLKSEEQLLTAVDIAKLGYWEYNIVKDEFLFNDQFYKIFKTTAEEVGGYKMSAAEYSKRFLHPDHADLVANEIRKAVRIKEKTYSDTLEHKVLFADGNTGYISVRYFVGKDSGGKTIMAFGVNQDITERKTAEEELKKRNEFIQTVLDNLPIGIALNDMNEGTTTYINKRFEKIYGWPASDLKDINKFFECVYPDEEYRKKISEKVIKDIESRDPSRMHWEDITITTKTGEKRTINAQDIPLFEQNTLVSTVIDVTRQKEAEKRIKESDEKQRKLISNISDVIVVLDNEGIIKYKSPNIENIFGWKPEDLIGRHALATVHPDDKERITNKLSELLQKDYKKVTVEYKYKCKNGEYKPIELTATNLLNDKVINGILANYRDITERKKAEKAVVESQRLGAIGEMSSAVAHDFNNSLQSIFGNLELAILKLDDNNPVRPYLDTIKTAASDAAHRVRLLQRFAGTPKYRDEYSAVDINRIIKDVIVQSRPIWKDNPEKEGVSIKLETELGNPEKVSGNDAELRSVIYNLIKNSVEAMPEGGVIKISTYGDDNTVNMLLRDNGEGMDDNTKSRIFQPFFTTKGFESGRGLGMSGAYSIINEHGGNIYVVFSEPGEGTEIMITLPVTKSEETETVEEQAGEENTAARILFVDDDEEIRDVMRDIFEVFGHDYSISKNADEALELITRKEFDLVITDIGMPGMNGWELSRKINEITGGKIPVAILSGWGAQISEEDLRDNGAAYLLEKPVLIKNVQKLVSGVMQEKNK